MKDAGLDQYEAPPRADADTEELRARLAGLERELQAERQSAERELRAARRTASRLEESERQARIDAERAQQIAKAARDEAKRARADAEATREAGSDTADGGGGLTPYGSEGGLTPLRGLTDRIIELEATVEQLTDENDRLRRALGQVREAMGVDDSADLEPEDADAPVSVLEAV